MKPVTPLYIFDIDGTLADCQHRIHYVRNEDGTKKQHGEADWDSFHRGCADDTPIIPVWKTLGYLNAFADIYFFSGRNEGTDVAGRPEYRNRTELWLGRQFVSVLGWTTRTVTQYNIPARLYMRGQSDRRQDCLVKADMYDALSVEDKQRLVGVFDDRDQVVRMWRDKGVQCFQCNYGDF